MKNIAGMKQAQVDFIVFEDYDEGCNHFSENYVIGLHVVVRGMLPIDLLFIKGSEISSVIDSFDCSLNKSVLTEDGAIVGLNLDKFEYTGTCIGRFRRFVDMYTSLLEKKNQEPMAITNIFGE